MTISEADDRRFLARAIELAEKGRGLVSPNPLVGCVIVAADGQVIGEGTYRYDGVTHAEVIALEAAGERSRGSTAYVSLEPHAHHGRTPPCTDALINAGVARVVCPIEDPNPAVSGLGFERLKAAGIAVDVGSLAKQASVQNESFITWHRRRRPFVHLKLASSIDGRISLGRSVSTALSSDDGRKRVQEFRHAADAILVGGTTAVIDDPNLTDRSGLSRRRKLVRVILDNRLRLPIDSQLVRTAGEFPVIVISRSRDEKAAQLRDLGVEVVNLDARDLNGVLAELYNRELQTVLVEGGTETAGSFVDARLVDRLTMMVAPVVIGGQTAPAAVGGNGVSSIADALRLQNIEVRRHGDDIELTGTAGD